MLARVLCRLLCGTCASPLLGEQQRWRKSACCAEVGIRPGARLATARGCIWLLYEMRYIPDNSLQRAFSYCVLLFVSTGFAGNPVRCIDVRVACCHSLPDAVGFSDA